MHTPDPSEHRPERFGFQHQQDLEALEKSSISCPLCSLIYEGVNKFVWNVANGERTGSNGQAYPTIGPKDYRLQVTKPFENLDGFIIWTDATEHGYIFLVAAVGLCVKDEDNPLAHQFRGRPVDEDASSETTLSRYSEWIRKCNEEHSECNPGLAKLPARVLEVGNQSLPSNIRLLETKGACGLYTALSHCWGASKHFTTTLATIDDRKKEIDLDEMPKTFQDAVAITRSLGIPYLWVDSLCICQDDSADWEREASRMADVYANSYLTIAAASAKDGSMGCFTRRPTRKYAMFDYVSKTGTSGQLQAFLLPVENAEFMYKYIEMEDEPLNVRAWTFQERILSSRTLFYGTHQMCFECKEEFFTEDGFHFKGRYVDIHVHSNESDLEPEDREGELRELWSELLTAYTSRKLTYSSDKLPALSGLAQRFEGMLKDKYIAGHWERTLLADLLWTAGDDDGAPWPPKYRAPSWSWLAVEGAQTAWGEHGEFEESATILSYDIHAKGENPYGEVDYGWIKLRAPLFQVEVDENPASRPWDNVFGFTIGGVPIQDNALLDYKIDYGTLRQLSLSVVLFGRENSFNGITYPSLLVTPAGEDSRTYRRLGMLLVDECLGVCKPSFDDGNPEITLV